LEAYLAETPSGPGRWPDPSRWTEPNNSVSEVEYEPEVVRYGGESALAEAHFQDASEVAVEALTRIRGSVNGRSLRLAYALQLTAMLPFSAGIPRNQIGDYFADHLTHILGSGGPDARYASYYAANRQTFVKKFASVVAYYEGNATTTDPLVQAWRRSSERTFRQLDALLTCEGSAFPEIHPQLGFNAKYLLVLQSHIHMLLNRLGYWGDAEELVLRLLHDGFCDPRLVARSVPSAAARIHG
jgi:thiopeptide-type bacteriocin biosynthesis protein